MTWRVTFTTARALPSSAVIGHFSTIWLMSLEELIRSAWKFHQRCNCGQVSPRYIFDVIQICSPDLDPDSGSGFWIRTRFTLAEVCYCGIPHNTAYDTALGHSGSHVSTFYMLLTYTAPACYGNHVTHQHEGHIYLCSAEKVRWMKGLNDVNLEYFNTACVSYWSYVLTENVGYCRIYSLLTHNFDELVLPDDYRYSLQSYRELCGLQCTPLMCIGCGLTGSYAHKRSMQISEVH